MATAQGRAVVAAPGYPLVFVGYTIRNFRDAEEAARLHLMSLGHTDAKVTADGPDGGVDVRTATAVAQVKLQGSPVGAPIVQQIFGVAKSEGKEAACYALDGYTREAVLFANRTGTALFKFDYEGDAEPVNEIASRWINESELLASSSAAAAFEQERALSLAIAVEKATSDELRRIEEGWAPCRLCGTLTPKSNEEGRPWCRRCQRLGRSTSSL